MADDISQDPRVQHNVERRRKFLADRSPSRHRYETYCGGRLLKVYDQVAVPDPGMRPDEIPYVNGSHRWVVDGQYVAADVAQAMLAKEQS